MSSKKKKLGRVPKACDNCKKNKQKCDVEAPCFRCKKKKIECCFKGKPAVPNSKKNGSNLSLTLARERLIEDLLMTYFLSLGSEITIEEWSQFNDIPICLPQLQEEEASPTNSQQTTFNWEDNEEAKLAEELRIAESGMNTDAMKIKQEEITWDSMTFG